MRAADNALAHEPPRAQPLALRRQFATAPAAVIGAFGAGFINTGMLTLAPLYAAERFGAAGAGAFYSAAWIGSLILQWPAGRLSDRIDRRVVIALLTGLAAGTGLSIVRALVRDELRGTLELRSGDGLRAEVVFPA